MRRSMVIRVWSYLSALYAHPWALPAIFLLSLCAFYALYVIKMHLGIDFFPNWGLHLPGPRSAVRMVAHKLDLW